MEGASGKLKMPIPTKQPRPEYIPKPKSIPEYIPKPKSIKSPGKGKLMSTDGKRYVSGTEKEDTGPSDIESQVGTDKGEEVDSPVVGVSTKKSKSTKRKRSPSSSSSSGSETDASLASKSSHVSSHVSHVSRSHLPKSITLSPSQNNDKHREKKRRSDKHKSYHHSSRKSRDIPPPPPQFQIEDLQIPPPPSKETNELLKTLMINRANTHKDIDNVSKVSSVSKSRSRSVIPQKDYTKEDHLKELPEELQKIDVVVETVEYIMYRFSRRGPRSAEIKYISHIPNSEKEFNLKIDTKGYLLSPEVGGFGYDHEKIDNNRELVESTLFHALSPACRVEKDSLDEVFRKSLKEIASELYDYNPNGNLSLDNPTLISGRYLELKLLDKMRKYYQLHYEEDIIEFFSKSCPDRTQKNIPGLVKECTSEMYIRVLHDRYSLKGDTFDEKLKESLTPRNMRVWTNHNHQDTVNMKLSELLLNIKNEISNSRTAGQKTTKFRDEFCKLYREKMKVFMDEYDTFLSHVLKSSELMAWMCFGITMNDLSSGILNMACSFLFVMKQSKFENTNKKVCWNYPLASIYRNATAPPTGPALPYETFSWNDVDKELEGDQTEEQHK